jgi:UDP-N-acetylmuramate dehydrogenase
VGVQVRAGVPLAELTTLRVGGPAGRLVEVDTEADLVTAVRDVLAAGEQLLVLGGGSNVVVADAGFAGTVVLVRTRGTTCTVSGERVRLDVAAGEPWDQVVAEAVAQGWCGIEALSGIPGLTGATPIQNVGAYGQQVSDTLVDVRALDRRTGAVVTLTAAQCGLGYRRSALKDQPARFVILSVGMVLAPGGAGAPVRYEELARLLEAGPQVAVPPAQVRAGVLALRRRKGMLLDPADHDTWSVGSFFTNPVLTASMAQGLPASAPRHQAGDGMVKTSAAWLIEHSGFSRGYRPSASSPVALSGKHSLAITNVGGAGARDVLALARQVRAAVRERYAITLEPEPVLVGCSLD